MKEPYIGITGFKNPEDTKIVNDWVTDNEQRLSSIGYRVMFGFTVSNKRLEDRNSEGKTSPNLLSLGYLCGDVTCDIITMLHYFTDKPENLVAEVSTLFKDPEIAGDDSGSRGLYEKLYCTAVQLNQDWPDPKAILALKEKFSALEVVVQLSPKCLEASDSEISSRIEAYAPLADYLLIDPSGGQGKALDLERTKVLLPMLQRKLPDTRIGIAGGLGPENLKAVVSELKPVSQQKFCIDAQGKLRTNGQLDSDKVIAYLEQALEALA